MWNNDITTATAVMKAASQPENLFWMPSSFSIISSARFIAASLISAAGVCRRAASSLIVSPKMKSPAGGPGGALVPRNSLDLDALLRVELDCAGMPGDRRILRLLVLELDVHRLGVHPHQIDDVVEQGLGDQVGRLVVHACIHREQVG